MRQKQYTLFQMAAVVLMMALVTIACGGGDGASQADLATGKSVYKIYCVACHGIDGKLNLNGAKDFTQSTLSLAERTNIITNGKGLMTPFKAVLSQEEIDAVAAYTVQLTNGKQ